MNTGPTRTRLRKVRGLLAKSPLADALGHLEYLTGNQRKFYPWGGAMNGQTARQEYVRSMVETLGIRQIVETGTYRGTTTEWLASFGVPVITIEMSRRFHAFAAMRLKRFGNVTLVRGESSSFFERRLPALLDTALPTLFYLDAHWGDYLPLAKELNLAFARFSLAYAVIDDFEVPYDAGYAFDDFGKAGAISVTYLEREVEGPLFVFLPTVHSSQETGQRRGSAVVARNPECANELFKIGGIRSWVRTEPAQTGAVANRTAG